MKENFIQILRNRAMFRWRKFFPEKRPEHLLHHKSWEEMTLWEKRTYGGKDGQPIPIKSFCGGPLPSHEDCEHILDQALRISMLDRIRGNW